jgi:hypothetical protein
MLTHHKDVDAEKEMREAFKVFDRENKGEVATSELKAVLTTMGEKLDAEEVCLFLVLFFTSTRSPFLLSRSSLLSERVTKVERFIWKILFRHSFVQ